MKLGVVAFCALASCVPTEKEVRDAAILAGYEAELDACVASSKTYVAYEACAGGVDERYGVHVKGGAK